MIGWVPLVLLALSAATTEAAPDGKDPAARGLDAFLQVPSEAPPGSVFPIQAMVYGFPTARTLVALGGATIEAAWDPDSPALKGAAPPPPPVQATADASGRVHLELPTPDGDHGELRLLVGLRSGAHQRTRVLKVMRARPYDLSVVVPDSRVVPGTEIPAWVMVRNRNTQQPVPGARVELALVEGGVDCAMVPLVTDNAGTAVGRVRIPGVEEPSWSWKLEARVAGAAKKGWTGAYIQLTPRLETPGKPEVKAWWRGIYALAGSRSDWYLRVRDAAGTEVSNQVVHTWVGLKSTRPPKELSKWSRVTTNTDGVASGTFQTPSTVSPLVKTLVQVVARTTLDGQEIESTGELEIGPAVPTVRILTQSNMLVPGLDQKLVLQATDGHDKPVQGTFLVQGDRLKSEVQTDANGIAEVSWKTPVDLGNYRTAGPCSSEVAARVTVTPVGNNPAFGDRKDPFESCVRVNRDAKALLSVDPPMARAGDKIRVRMPGGGRVAWSVSGTDRSKGLWTTAWIPDGESGGELQIPEGAWGELRLRAISPRTDGKALVADGALLVLPRELPMLTAKVAGGRPAPGGQIELDVDLTDGKGKGMPGTVAALVYDTRGGGSSYMLYRLDTRRELCRTAGVVDSECDKFLSGDAKLDPVRRAYVSQSSSLDETFVDPAGDVESSLNKAFSSIVRSLEGAVLESSESPERLRDARVKGPQGWTFHPELFSLVTDAMDDKPVTPGGEPLTLADAVGIDRQVTFDNVARRVTRLKLLRAMAKVRTWVREHYVDPDEPALRDPPAVLRRLVRERQLSDGDLLDPWGGSLQFVKGAHNGNLPFLTLSGWALQSPGPDGKAGTGDDVRSPFDRVLRSGSPYAEAMSEDRIVDARLDMQVSEETVGAWDRLLQEFTGTHLGLGTGTGEGFGSGHGRLGGSHRSRPPQVRMGATTVGGDGETAWLPPARTDSRGHLRLVVPLGKTETTWGVALVGIPDRGRPAVTEVEVPVSLPVSARIEPGLSWVAGDEVDVAVSLRNRTATSVRASVGFAPSGVAQLANAADATRVVDIPAQGAVHTTVRLRAPSSGEASLRASVSGGPAGSDTTQVVWQVRPAGEVTELVDTYWVEGETELSLPAKGASYPSSMVLLERGHAPSILAAMGALDPDRQKTPEGAAHSLEAAMRLYRWALTRGGQKDPVAERAISAARRASGRVRAYDRIDTAKGSWSDVQSRMQVDTSLLEELSLPKPRECPPQGTPTLVMGLDLLESEPAPVGGAVKACWDTFVTTTVDNAVRAGDPVSLARAIVALAERPHRSHMTAAIADRLREGVRLRPSGLVALEGKLASDRSARALVYAALARSATLGNKSLAPIDRLLGWLEAQRDTYGGYGSSLATLAALRAFLASPDEPAAESRVAVEGGGVKVTWTLKPGASVSLPMRESDKHLKIWVDGPAVMARVGRKELRPWSRPPYGGTSPVGLEVVWPDTPQVGKPATLRVVMRHSLGRETTVDARIPLPPGVRVAGAVPEARTMPGLLFLRWKANASNLPHVMEIPIRFELSGRITIPEAHARLAFEESERGVAPARPIVVGK